MQARPQAAVPSPCFSFALAPQDTHILVGISCFVKTKRRDHCSHDEGDEIVINVHKVSLHYTIITNMRGRGLFKRAMEKILLMNLKNIIENKNEELPMSVASLLGVQRQSKVLLHFSH